MRRLRVCVGISALCLVSPLVACIDRELAPLSPCLVSNVHDTISVKNIDSVDVLFLVDNSISMREEQTALVRELPQLVRVLSSGDRDQDGVQDFKPVELRLGVVSSDMGLPGVGGACPADLGDNAVLQHVSNPTMNPTLNCQANYPAPFLSFSPQTILDPTAVDRVSNDFACISTLGTTGCGFEQQLEASLKALWPSDHMVQGQDMRAALGQFPSFAIDPATQQGANGNGDPLGANAGFLHNDPARGLSLIAVVVVTDEEDCSSWNLGHFVPQNALGPDDPLRTQHPNLRCFMNKPNLYPVQRYIDGLKALRPGQEDLVVFGAITGVAPALVDATQLAQVNFGSPASVNAFYDRILADDSMTERVNATGDNLVPSCNPIVNGVEQKAYPPRRIVEVARGFGKNGIVQSICEDSFAPAMSRIIELIIGNLKDVCLPRKLVRDVTGEVGCRIVWELPAVSQIAPTTCNDPRYAGILAPLPDGLINRTDDGRLMCDVTQLPVGPCSSTGQADDPCATGVGPLRALSSGGAEGWYYDDFSIHTRACLAVDKQRIAFSAGAQPPTGVVVRLDCTSEVQSLVSLRTDLLNSTMSVDIGDECAEHVDCAVALSDAAECRNGRSFRQDISGTCFDVSMFCHPSNKRCVQACITNADCPSAWQCDTEGLFNPLSETENHPICVNPTCGQ